MRIRALVVDDQPMARDRIVSLLATEPDVDVVGTAASGREAVAAVERLAPDLVFLDLQMPELDGLGVVETIGLARMPLTIFVTAYDEYAIRAFEVHALDYLLKPFGRLRLQQALEHARRHLARNRAGALAERLAAMFDELKTPVRRGPRLMVRANGRVSFIQIEQIEWVEAEGNYARLHVGTESHLVRETMANLLGQLGEEQFFRTHRSHIVNIGRIRELRVASGGDYDVVLKSGVTVALSRLYRDALQARLARGG